MNKLFVPLVIILLVGIFIASGCGSPTTTPSTTAAAKPITSTPALSAAPLASSATKPTQAPPSATAAPQYGGTIKVVINIKVVNLGSMES
jgi:hypothetical protein